MRNITNSAYINNSGWINQSPLVTFPNILPLKRLGYVHSPTFRKRRDKVKPYAKDAQNETETRDPNEQPAVCRVCEVVIN